MLGGRADDLHEGGTTAAYPRAFGSPGRAAVGADFVSCHAGGPVERAWGRPWSCIRPTSICRRTAPSRRSG
eukprot:6317810-Lingulodinium_polyedra.AAC.1